MSAVTKVISGVVVAVLVLALAVVLLTGGESRTATAYFERTVGLYEGSEVRVLGVPVGTVTDIEPLGQSVQVEMEYDPDLAEIPADGGLVIVTPTVVSDRYVEITPVATSGPVLEDGAVIPLQRTSIPFELDEIFGSLTDLSVALGPDGANANGALNDLLGVSAANLDGNGQRINDTLSNFADFVTVLDDNSDDLFGTIGNLQLFTTELAERDATVRAFNESLAGTARLLDEQKENLALFLEELSVALEQVTGFVGGEPGPADQGHPGPHHLHVVAAAQPRRAAGVPGHGARGAPEPEPRLQRQLGDAGHPEQPRRQPRRPGGAAVQRPEPGAAGVPGGPAAAARRRVAGRAGPRRPPQHRAAGTGRRARRPGRRRRRRWRRRGTSGARAARTGRRGRSPGAAGPGRSAGGRDRPLGRAPLHDRGGA